MCILKIEYRRNDADYHQAIDEIEHRKHKHHESRCFEEDSRFRAPLDTERTETDKGKDWQRAESKCEHGKTTAQKASRGKRVELH